MRFEDQGESGNVEDQRGAGGGGGSPFGGGGGFGGMRVPFGTGGMGVGGLVVLVGIAWLLGVNPLALLGGGGGGMPLPASWSNPNSMTPPRETPEEQQRVHFVGRVLKTTETCWHAIFEGRLHRQYEEPHLVLFRDGVRSACGQADAAMGPFYCPGDHKVYIDLSFYDVLRDRLGAGGDFAQAYVVAHEVGHHVQNLLGISDRVHALHGRVGEAEYNRESVHLELQADYLAGVWAHYVEHDLKGKVELEAGDYDEAIRAANSIGDDTLQKRATGRVVPEKFTHGTSAQRMKWFRLGYESGDPLAHDPFKEEK